MQQTTRSKLRDLLTLRAWRPDRRTPVTDPFAPGVISKAPEKSHVPIPRFDSIPRMDMEVIKQMGQRAAQILQGMKDSGRNIEVPPWPMCACDIAVAHLRRPLDLNRFARADDVAFMAAYMLIAQKMNRLTFQIDGLQNHPYIRRGVW